MANNDDEIEKILKELTDSSKAGKSKEQEAEQKPANETARNNADEKPEEPRFEKKSEEPAPERREPERTERETPVMGMDSYISSFDEEDTDNSFDEWEDNEYDDYGKNRGGKTKSKTLIIVIIIVALVAAAVAGAYFAFFRGKEPETTTAPTTTTTTTAAPVIIKNPLTGEKDYNEAAVELRPIAIAVDNSLGARPQYNINAADMIVEGEVEGGETRHLWFFSDMTNLPEMLGPTRSARPSYIQFSELFDAIFVHYGGSHSKGDYVGGYDIIKQDGVNDIDGMTVSSCFKRTSDKKAPHNAALLGNKLVEVIDKKGYRKTVDKSKFTQFEFNDSVVPVSQTPCNSAVIKFSSNTGSRKFIYDSAKKTYTNDSDYKATVSFTNVITLFAESTYIVKYNYMQQGRNETYLNYSLTSGTGKLISCGTAADIKWSVKDGRLSLTDASGNPVSINPGKSYIALASSNYNGTVTIG